MSPLAQFFATTNATFDYSQPVIEHAMAHQSVSMSVLLGPPSDSDITNLVLTGVEYTDAVARVLPVDEEADHLVAPLFAVDTQRRRPIRRR